MTMSKTNEVMHNNTAAVVQLCFYKSQTASTRSVIIYHAVKKYLNVTVTIHNVIKKLNSR